MKREPQQASLLFQAKASARALADVSRRYRRIKLAIKLLVQGRRELGQLL